MVDRRSQGHPVFANAVGARFAARPAVCYSIATPAGLERALACAPKPAATSISPAPTVPAIPDKAAQGKVQSRAPRFFRRLFSPAIFVAPTDGLPSAAASPTGTPRTSG